MLLADKKLVLYAAKKYQSQQLVRLVPTLKAFMSFLERPIVEVFLHYLQPGQMIYQPSNCAHVVLTLSKTRSVVAGCEGCDLRRVSDCLKQYPSPLSVETISGVFNRSPNNDTFVSKLVDLSESKNKKKQPDDHLMELTGHVSQLNDHFNLKDLFELPQTVAPRRTPRVVAAERSQHFEDDFTRLFYNGCPGEVGNITPRFKSQIASQKWSNLEVKVS